ncbi:MAG: hypothetical protein HQ553_05400 [Chloroflexi bacterium]|nr:hypothetical protein [Chloroflexota bacterium]
MRKIILFVTLIYLILVSLITVGCSSSDGEETKSPEETETVAVITPEKTGQENRDTSIEMMKRVPATLREFEFMDIAAIRMDDDLESLYNNWHYEYGWVIKPLGMDVREVTGFGTAGYSLLIEGSYNPITVRAKLKNRNLESGGFEGVETWISEDSWIALMDSLIISANATDGRELKNVIKGEAPSLYDNKDFKDVIDRLPEGIILWFKEGWFRDNYQYDGLKVTGMSAVKRDKHSMAFTWICKFENTDAAQYAMDEIELDMVNDGEKMWLDINMAQYKQFLKVTAELAIN